MTVPFQGFPPGTMKFLRQLRRNNNREWFAGHKAEYEQYLKQPMLQCVEALGGVLQGIAPELNTDPKKAIFRIYRDTRFSPDKTPYKTQVAAHFSPVMPAERSGAGLYFHVEPGGVLIAAGIYMPGSAELREIRNYIAGHGKELRLLLRSPRVRKYYGGLQGEQAKRPPRGFLPSHPEMDLLRYKQFIVWTEKPAALAQTPELFRALVEGFVAGIPLVRFLNTPLGVRV